MPPVPEGTVSHSTVVQGYTAHPYCVSMSPDGPTRPSDFLRARRLGSAAMAARCGVLLLLAPACSGDGGLPDPVLVAASAPSNVRLSGAGKGDFAFRIEPTKRLNIKFTYPIKKNIFHNDV